MIKAGLRDGYIEGEKNNMKKKRVAALVMAAILGVTGFSVPGIGVVQAEEAHTEMSGETEQQEINLAADRGSTARASKFAASATFPQENRGLRLTEFPIITEKRITADGKVERTRSFQSSGWK